MNNESNVYRSKQGIRCGIVGIIANLILFALKAAIGFVSCSVSLIGDAFNNASDSLSSLVNVVSFKMNKKPADKKHPYGHKRSEYIGGLIISILIVITSIELFTSSISKIINPTLIDITAGLLIVLIANIVIKLGLVIYYKIISKKLDSISLKASYLDAIFDLITTGIVVGGLYLSKAINYDLDGILGILLAIVIFINGIKLINESCSKLLVETPSPELVNKILTEIKSDNHILGIHDDMFHQYGVDTLFMSVHVEMDASLTLTNAHNIVDKIERRIKNKYNVDCCIHIDPVDLGDENLKKVKKEIESIVYNIDSNLTCHDIHIVKDNNRVYFDLVLPYSYASRAKEFVDIINEEINKKIDYKVSIEINYK